MDCRCDGVLMDGIVRADGERGRRITSAILSAIRTTSSITDQSRCIAEDTTMPSETPRRSLMTTGGPGRAPNRAMLRAVGFHDEDFQRPMVGVASLYSDITPCN